MKPHVLVLGAGFGGLEIASTLSDTLGERVDVTLIDRSDSFVFGYSKLEVMFGEKRPSEVRLPYGRISRPGVVFRRETVTAIDPLNRTATTDRATYQADFMVVALGADYDVAATPGLGDGAQHFYSMENAERLREVVAGFSAGRAVIGVCGAPFKCPPAPSEAALLLHDHLSRRGVRQACEIMLVMPFAIPVPPSPETSQALLEAFAERGIAFVSGRSVAALDTARRVAVLDNGDEMPYDLFLGVPRHRAPAVVLESGLAADGWIPVDPATLATRFPGVYAVGDVTSVGTPKAGVFAEGAARVVAERLAAELASGPEPPPYAGAGSCYVEFGGGQVARVDVNFLAGPSPTGKFHPPSPELAADKASFGSSRRSRWFGIED